MAGLLALCPLSCHNKPHDTPPAVTCAEDDPCWDCHTMGNHVCGPEFK